MSDNTQRAVCRSYMRYVELDTVKRRLLCDSAVGCRPDAAALDMHNGHLYKFHAKLESPNLKISESTSTIPQISPMIAFGDDKFGRGVCRTSEDLIWKICG